MRTTLAQLRASRIPAYLGLCATDPRIVQWCNEAQQRLLTGGDWVGTYGRYVFCLDEGCITWPRQIATIDAVAVCDRPIQVRNEWFEFLDSGPWIQSGDSCNNDSNSPFCNRYGGLQLYDRGEAVTFADIRGTNKKIKVYIDNANDAGKTILIQGYDENGQWILTDDGSTDGELVTLAALPVTTTHFFSSITGIQKQVTKGNVRLYEYDTDEATQRAIAVYEPDETTPVYRRSIIPGLSQLSNNGCCNTDEDCTTKTVTVMAKLAFIPVVKDTDYLIISNLGAMKLAMKALQMEENNQFQDADYLMNGRYDAAGKKVGGAVQILEDELRRYLGQSVPSLRVMNAAQDGPPVLNLI